MRSTKGFTLVELLAVIVILAVIMLMGATAIGPLMEKSRKSSLGTEGLDMVNAAKLAFQVEQMSNPNIKSNKTTCFSLSWLYNHNYFDKGSGIDKDGYAGSVLIAYDEGIYSYKFWITNGTHGFLDTSSNGFDYNKAVAFDNAKLSEYNNCGGTYTPVA